MEQKPNHDHGRREKSTGGILTHIAKFAIDSTINYSLKFKAFSGRKQVYEIVQERLKDQTPSACLDKKKPEDVNLGMELVEEMQAKIKKIQESSNIIKQNKISAKPVKRSGQPKKMTDESVQGLGVTENDRKKIFIRSRL